MCDCHAAVPARGRVAQKRAPLKAQLKAAGVTLTAPKRESATELQLSVLPLNQRQTSPPATLIPKCASAGYVGIIRCFIVQFCFVFALSVLF